MFKNIDELKDFIVWAKKQQIKSLTVGEVSVEVSDVYYANELVNGNSEPIPEYKPSSKRFIDDPQTDVDDEELLMWSSGG